MPDAPTRAHKYALYSTLRYLVSNRTLGLTFRKGGGLMLDSGYDASFGNEVTDGATGGASARAGGYIRLQGAAINAWTKRCRYVALSTNEAELYAFVLLLRRLLCVRRLLALILGYSLPLTIIDEDNKAVHQMLRKTRSNEQIASCSGEY